MTTTRRTFLCAVPAAAAFLAAGCHLDSEDDNLNIAALPEKIVPTIETAEKYGTGLTVGKLDSSRHVVVFFDPLCPHCAYLWDETKRLWAHAKFTWYPVNAVSPEHSRWAAAEILEAPDKVKAMDDHAKGFVRLENGRMTPPEVKSRSVSDKMSKQIEMNLNLLARMGARGVPFYITKHEKSGQVLSGSRTFAAAAMALDFGWDVPADSIK